MFRLMIGEWREVWIVALSALAVYLFTALAVRLSERRTLARMSHSISSSLSRSAPSSDGPQRARLQRS